MPEFTDTTSAREFATALRENTNLGLPDDWCTWENVLEAHRILAQEFLAELQPPPDKRFRGRGIVICAGGQRLFTNAWVCLRNLRKLGCTLPVQFWHLDGEIDGYMESLIEPYDALCVNANAIARRLVPLPRILNGWELKAFALLHSPFRDVMLLDADNVAVVDPTFLFETPEFQTAGAIFWPDYGRMEVERKMWQATDVEYRDEPEFESGQIVVDKMRCWQALNLSMHYNEHSDFYYRHVHGDKCTFRFAWHRTKTSFAMPPFPIHALHATMCQHDFSGRRIFQHRNLDKWRLDGSNEHINDFWQEDDCRVYIKDLSRCWNGRPFRTSDTSAAARHLRNLIVSNSFVYRRVGFDERKMVFHDDGMIGEGAADCEREWTIAGSRTGPVLSLSGDHGVICQMSLIPDGRLCGRWLNFERMPVELIPESTTA